MAEDYKLNNEAEWLAEDNLSSDDLADADGDSSELDALMQTVNVQTEKLEGRQRQISANIEIPHPVEHIWSILTDYETLADFIPNLSKSCKIEHPSGGIRIEQVGTQSLMKMRFCARVVLDMFEKFPNQIDFNMVEGDFKVFSGSWLLHPTTLRDEFGAEQAGTDLHYKLIVCPRRTMPVGLIERRLSKGLALNLISIRQRAIALAD